MLSHTVDPAFAAVPRRATGFYVWRVEKAGAVLVPREELGQFRTNSCYVVLSIHETEDCEPDIHIHYWIGSHASQIEEGITARKAVELDDFLGGSPKQHREAEGSESAAFLRHFRGVLRYIKDESGLASHASRGSGPHARLLHVKGRAQIRCVEVEKSWSSFNDGDVYILDLDTSIFIWQGKSCNRLEKVNAMTFAQTLKSERSKGEIITVESGQEDAMGDNEKKLWDQHLPLSQRNVKSASEELSDELHDKVALETQQLFQCSDQDGQLHVTFIKKGPLNASDLDSNDAFIVDAGQAGVWVWIGKKSTATEKREAMKNATEFARQKGYCKTTPIARVIEGAEPAEFTSLFKTWKPAASAR